MKKKLRYLLGGLLFAFAGSSSFAQVTSYPYTEDFETETQGSTACGGTYTMVSAGWTNLTTGDNADWSADQGGTGSFGTGPSVDKNPGTASGKYLYLETSCSSVPRTAILESPIFDVTSITPYLDYGLHMFGATMGNTVVQARTGTGPWTTVDSLAGDQGNQWLTRSVDLSMYTTATDLQLRFIATRGTSFTSDMAIDDVVIYDNPPCVAPPTAGVAASSGTGPVCASDNFDLSLTGTSAGSGITYQWQSSPNNSTWTDIAGATSSPFTTTQSADTWYRCIVTCSGVSDTSTSVLQISDSFINCYCTSSATSTTFGLIQRVTFNTIDEFSGSGCGQQYTDNSHITTSVFMGSSYSIDVDVQGCSGGQWTHSTKAWIDYNQNGLFTDPGEEILVQGGHQYGIVSANVTVPATATPGLTRMRVVTEETGSAANVFPCGPYTWGETEDYTVMVIPVVTNDAGIAEVNSPGVPACVLSDSVMVTLSNFGTASLTQAMVNWSVNGALQTPVLYNGNIPSYSNDTVPFFVGTSTFNGGEVLKVWTSMPNGTTDSVAFNDTITYVVDLPSLNGLYTIDPNAAASATNFVTIADAVNALNVSGVCGPVTMELADNVFTGEQFNLNDIPGASSTNRVVFTSASNDTALCIVEYSTSNSFDGAINFTNTSYVTFEDITLYNTATAQAFPWQATRANVVTLNGMVEGIEFHGCRIINNQVNSTQADASLVYKTNTSVATDVVFDGNTFDNGGYGLFFVGDGASPDKNTQVLNNEFNNQTFYGIFTQVQEDPTIYRNTVASTSTYNSTFTPGTGIFMQQFNGDNIFVANNHVYQDTASTWPQRGIHVEDFAGGLNGFGQVQGNAVSMPNGGEFGIGFVGNVFVDITNNSAYLSDQSSSHSAIFVAQGSYNSFKNNAASGADQAVAVDFSTPSSIFESDYNAYSSDGGFVNWGTPQADLASLQGANGMDMNSVAVSMIFSDTMNLLVCNDTLDGTGDASIAYMADIQGDPVAAMAMDIGSDQFATPASFDVRDTVGLCTGDTAVLEAWYFDSIVWNFGAGFGNIYETPNPGVVTVDAYGLCGQANDVVNVLPATPVSLPANAIICTDSTGTIDAGIANGTYIWSNGATTQSIVVGTTGSYSVTVTDQDGCISDDATTAVMSVPVDIADETGLCDGNPATLDAGISGGTYAWSTGDATQTTVVGSAGVYSVTVTDADGCVSEDATTVIEQVSPDADFTSFSSFYTAEFTNNSQNGTSFIWSFGDGDSSFVENPTHLYNWTNDSAITYTVVLITSNSCGSDTATYEVTVGNAVGYNELANGASYDVYPNPNNGAFNILLNNTGNEEVSFVIVDVQGKVITQRNLGFVDNAHQESVDVNGVAPGIYFLRLSIGDQTTVERVAIK